MDKLEMENRILRLEKLLGTFASFANENLDSFNSWTEDNRESDPNVEMLANFVEAFYNE